MDSPEAIAEIGDMQAGERFAHAHLT